ncbi:MAG: LytTR family DNA-binding domain-containing protein [Bacteroidota bacterium]
MKRPAIILDDDQADRDHLIQMIEVHAPDISVLAAMSFGEMAISLVEAYQPKVVLCETRSEGGDPFEWLHNLPQRSFEVVFVTRDKSKGIAAVKVRAADYLLKPVSPKELKTCLERLTSVVPPPTSVPIVPSARSRISLPNAFGIHLVELEQIIRIEGEENYSRVFLHQQEPILMARTLKYVQQLIDSPQFIRVHRKHLVNLHYVVSYQNQPAHVVIMEDGSRLPISRRKLSNFLTQLP